eukprot:Rmarinus@m.18951
MPDDAVQTEIEIGQFTSEEVKPLLHDRDSDVLVEEFSTEKKSGVALASFNTINIYAGLGLLSMPYALAIGGFLSLIVLLFSFFLLYYTGNCIVEVFDFARVTTYPEVAEKTFGKFGANIVRFLIIVELWGLIAVLFVFQWGTLLAIIPGATIKWVSMLSVLAVLPTVWIPNLSKISFISVIGTGAVVMLVVAVVGIFSGDAQVVHHQKYDIYSHGIALSAGIYMLSLGGHSCLPALYNSVAQPKKFPMVLLSSFAFMFVFYSLMAIAGYLTYGEDSKVSITDNIAEYPGGWVNTVVSIVIAVAIYTKVSPILSVVAEVILSAFLDMDRLHYPYLTHCSTRTVLTVLAAVVGYNCASILAVMESLIGGLSTMSLSVVLPPLMHNVLLWRQNSTLRRSVNIAASLLGLSAMVVITTYDVVSAVQQIHSSEDTDNVWPPVYDGPGGRGGGSGRGL